MATDEQRNTFLRLKALVDAGFASDEEKAEYGQMAGGGNTQVEPSAQGPQTITPAPVPTAPIAATVPNADDDDLVNYMPANTDAFQGGEWKEPPHEAVYPAVCVDFTYSQDDDRAMIIVANREGETPEFRGSLGASNVTAQEKSGAWAMRQALENLGIKYRIEEGRGVAIGSVTGVLCQADWQYIMSKGTRSMRVQNLYGADAVIETAT